MFRFVVRVVQLLVPPDRKSVASAKRAFQGGMVFGQSRQEDLITYLLAEIPEDERAGIMAELQIDLSPANRIQPPSPQETKCLPECVSISRDS